MKITSRIFAMALAAALQACVTPPIDAPRTAAIVAPQEQRAPVTILVSIDGFRPDYLQRKVTPNLNELAASGISGSMRPSFPSITFPNHWTLVTGLRPDRHGVVGNRMEDTAHPGMTFTMQSEEPFWWTQAEPIWITAEKAGIRSATMFWPGANVDFSGVRPQDWQQYGHEVSNRQRVDAVIDWLRRPAATRPRFLTLYFDTVDSAGHMNGPDGLKTNAAVAAVDAAIGQLRQALVTLGQSANLVIVSDHGMAATSPDRVIELDKVVDPTSFRFITGGPYVGLEPQPGKEATLAETLLKPHDHMQCWRKGELPNALHYGKHPRVPSFICLAEISWLINEKAPPADKPIKPGGAHGYDPAAPEMAAVFIANGPAIRASGPIRSFDNVDIAPLVRNLIGLPQDKTLDGDDARFKSALGQ